MRHRDPNATMDWAMDHGRERERDRDRGQESFMRESEREAFRADRERQAASQRQRLRSGRAMLRDALSYERPGQRMRLAHNNDDDMPDLGPMSDSARASYSEIVQRPQGVSSDGLTTEERRIIERARSPPPRYMPTPPYSFEETSNQLSPRRSTPPSGSAEYTARFAPAHNHSVVNLNGTEARLLENAERNASTGALLDGIESARRETLRTVEEADRTIEAADRALSELPPLRRMGRRSHLPSPPENGPSNIRSRPVVDGLGDRSRSFSPEDNVWDTLLSTITPDDRVPSAHSSFTSATASASASSSLASNSATNSYGTLVTAPSSNTSTADLYPTLCENTDSEDSLTEDEMQPEPSVSTNPHPRPVYSRRYHAGDRAEQLVNQDAERTRVERDARLRAMRGREAELEQIRGEREAELQRIQADLDRLNRQADRWFEEAGLERRAGRERL